MLTPRQVFGPTPEVFARILEDDINLTLDWLA